MKITNLTTGKVIDLTEHTTTELKPRPLPSEEFNKQLDELVLLEWDKIHDDSMGDHTMQHPKDTHAAWPGVGGILNPWVEDRIRLRFAQCSQPICTPTCSCRVSQTLPHQEPHEPSE